MAHIICPDCGAEVSDLAVACPGCARPIAHRATPGDRHRLHPVETIKRIAARETLVRLLGGAAVIIGFLLICAGIVTIAVTWSGIITPVRGELTRVVIRDGFVCTLVGVSAYLCGRFLTRSRRA